MSLLLGSRFWEPLPALGQLQAEINRLFSQAASGTTPARRAAFPRVNL